MVEQQTLTLYIAVRVRVPQPRFNHPLFASKEHIMNKPNIKKVFIENYKQYHIYKIIDANGNKIFNAESPYFLNDGCVTFAASSTNEIYKLINQKIKQLQSGHKNKRLK